MGLPVVRTGNVALDRFLEQVREFIESSKGGSSPTAAQNRVLRVSDVSNIVQLAAAGAVQAAKKMTQQEMESFAEGLSNTQVFQALTRGGSAVEGRLAGLPRTNITDVKVQRDASSAGAAVDAIVSAEGTRAVAALVTTVEARLDNFDGTASIEEAYLALADATTGLEAQYTVKVTAGGAVAGFGLAATDPVGGTPSSAFIVAADKFAVVSPSYSGGMTNAPAFANIPFGVDASGVYINGQVRINAGGPTIQDGIQGPPGPPGSPGSPGSPGTRGATRTVRTVPGLSSWNDAEANNAIYALGFSPVVRDEVTLRNADTAPTYLETRYWSGSGWATIGVTINGNLLVSGSITSDKIGTNELNAVNINTSGRIKSTGSFVSGASLPGIQAAICGENPYSSALTGKTEAGVSAYGQFAVYARCNQTGTGGDFNHAAVCAINSGAAGNAIWMQGFLAWTDNTTGATYRIAAPDGNASSVLRGDGTWGSPGGSGGVSSFNGRTGAVTLTYSDVNTAAAGNTLAVNISGDAQTVGGYSIAAIISAMNSAITDNNNNFVTPNFIRRSGSSFTLTIPGVGSWSGCTVS